MKEPIPAADDYSFSARGAWIAGALLFLFLCLLVASQIHKSVTFDELAHLTAGYTYWMYDDYRFQPENGNLPQRVDALPLLFQSLTVPSLQSPSWKGSDEWTWGYQWLYREGNDWRTMVISGRLGASFLALALGWLVWDWSRQLFGAAAGLFSLVLFATNPNILANGPLMTSDVACSLFLLAALRTGCQLIEVPSFGRATVAALFTGLALVSKASGLLIIPLLVGIFILRSCARKFVSEAENPPLPATWASWAIFMGGVDLVVWAFYGFRYSALAPAFSADSHLAVPWDILLRWDGSFSLLRSIVALSRHLGILPEGYLYGLVYVSDFSQGRSAFLNGHVSLNGWSSFFPYVFLVKNPLPFFLILGLALFLRTRAWIVDKQKLRLHTGPDLEKAALLLFVLLYGALAITSKLNIGARHLLPLYAPLFILCGGGLKASSLRNLRLDVSRNRAFMARGLLWVGLALLFLPVINWFPDYLSYVNCLAGGEAGGYRHLVDSSLDWGQDLPCAKRFIARHPQESPFYLAYFGNGSPVAENISAIDLFSYPGADDGPLFTSLETPPQEKPSQLPSIDMRSVPARDSPKSISFRMKSRDELILLPGTYIISATLLQPVLYSRTDGPWGAWNWRYEATYHDLATEMAPLLSANALTQTSALHARSPDEWNAIWFHFKEFRFARLTAYLRQRKPSEELGHGSILVYRLTQRDLAAALQGLPAEIKPDPYWAAH